MVGLLCSALGVQAQSSTFIYQGQLSSNGVAPTGLFDVRFALYDAATSGNQISFVITNSPTGITNGLFQVALTFGASAFDGSARWLELGVRTNGGTGAFTILAPRQQLAATPYAVRAATLSGTIASTNLTGKISDTNLSVNVALLTNNANFTQSLSASNFIGSGLGLTNLSVTNLIGTLPDARLSANVALKNAGTNAFLGSISATNYYGEGRGLTNVPGRIFEFVPTSGPITAYPNYGYLATNDATPAVVTLPANEQITNGNIVRVSGIGAAGWVIAQNANQTILLGNLLNNVGVHWTTNGSALSWKAIAASADGKKLVAATSGGSGQPYTSTNYGATWTPRTVLGNISSVASSADGTKLAACVNGSVIYTSTDSGASWTPRTSFGNRNWTGIASSLDGTKLVACASGVGVYVSTDSGVTWPASPNLAGAVSFSGVAASGNGSNLVAVIQGGQIYTSATNGVSGSWLPRESSRSWTCVASSADGSVLVAGVNSINNYLFTSTDFGASWIQGTIALSWAGVACSADGSRLIAVANGGGVYISQDTGMSWQPRANLPTAPNYTGAAASNDGSTLAAVANANGIFVSSKATTTVGPTGQLMGSRLAAVELQYAGNGVFIPLSSTGTIRAK